MRNRSISRRQMMKIGSAAALSTVVSGTSVPAAIPTSHSNDTSVMHPIVPGDVCYLTALELASLLKRKTISAREVMQAHLKQIAALNSKVNAIITLVPEEQLLAQALAAEDAIAKGISTGQLHGLPFAVKDLIETKGIMEDPKQFSKPLCREFKDVKVNKLLVLAKGDLF